MSKASRWAGYLASIFSIGFFTGVALSTIGRSKSKFLSVSINHHLNVMRLVHLVLVLPILFSAEAATLTIHVTKIDKKGGTLRVSLYDEAGWSKGEDTPVASANVPAVTPKTTVTLTDIKPGTYGVKLFQDSNNNGKFDQNFIGLPLERYGFSRDAKPLLSAPPFAKTKFTTTEGTNEITITLR